MTSRTSSAPCVRFFFNDTATTEIYTLSLHDALPIWLGEPGLRPPPRRHGARGAAGGARRPAPARHARPRRGERARDRKSTRLNSSHANISYAVFCLKTKNVMLSTAVLLELIMARYRK